MKEVSIPLYITDESKYLMDFSRDFVLRFMSSSFCYSVSSVFSGCSGYAVCRLSKYWDFRHKIHFAWICSLVSVFNCFKNVYLWFKRSRYFPKYFLLPFTVELVSKNTHICAIKRNYFILVHQQIRNLNASSESLCFLTHFA